MAGFGLLLVMVGSMMVWLSFNGVDWGQNPTGRDIIEGLASATEAMG